LDWISRLNCRLNWIFCLNCRLKLSFDIYRCRLNWCFVWIVVWNWVLTFIDVVWNWVLTFIDVNADHLLWGLTFIDVNCHLLVWWLVKLIQFTSGQVEAVGIRIPYVLQILLLLLKSLLACVSVCSEVISVSSAVVLLSLVVDVF
jgi:hypothetical protein